MPKFKITGPDGRTVTLSGETAPTEQELDQIFSEISTPQPESPSMLSSAKDTAFDMLGRGVDVLGRVTGTLGRLGTGVANVIDETVDTVQGEQSVGQGISDTVQRLKSTFTPTGVGKWENNTDINKVLENQGVEAWLKEKLGDKAGDWTTAGLGFVGDVLTDPLQIGAVNKGVSAGIKAVGGGIGDVARAVTPKSVQSALKQGFVPEYAAMAKHKAPGADINLAEKIRLHESSLRHAGEDATDQATKFFQTGPKPMAFRSAPEAVLADRQAFAHAIDKGTQAPANLADKVESWKKMADDIWAEKVEMGSTMKLFGPKGTPLKKGPKEILTKEENYIPYFTRKDQSAEAVVGPAFRTKTRTDKARKGYESLEEAVRHGSAPDDAREIMATMLTMHGRAKRTQEFLSSVAKEYGQTGAVAGTRKLNREAFSVSDKLWSELKDKHFSEDIAGYLERSVKLWEKPSEMDNLWKTGTKLFKGAATSINLPHHAVNFQGNVMNMYAAGGMSMKDIAKQMARSYGIIGKGKQMPSIKGFSSDELTRLAQEYEIVGTSGHLRDLAEVGTSDAILHNPLLQGMRKFGTDKIEEPARLALWMDGIEKGLTPAQSAIKVKNVLLDYAELTPFERQIRDYAIPFYTWARKNPVVQWKGLSEDPVKFANIGRGMNVGWNANAEQVEQTVVPEEWEARGMVPGPITSEDGSLVMQRIGLPQNDLNKLADPVGMVTEGIHPVLKMIAEAGLNQKTMGGKVSTDSGWTTPSAIASWVSAMTPDQLENMIPEALQGYVNVANVGGRPRQRDIASWLMSAIPTGLAGQVGKSQIDDPKTVEIPAMREEWIARLLGLTPRVLTGEQQQFEAQDRMKAHRQKMQRVVMDK